jgi:hypothetical protein
MFLQCLQYGRFALVTMNLGIRKSEKRRKGKNEATHGAKEVS